MSGKYQFETDLSAEKFVDEIADEMCRIFDISLDEAVFRINSHWKGQSIVGELDMVYREDAYFWANQIYCDDSCAWWVPGEKKIPKRIS